MCRRVDTEGEPADDGEMRIAQATGEGLGIRHPLGGGGAGTHDRKRRAVEQGRIALDVEHDRRIGDVEQRLRIVAVGQGQDAVSGFRAPCNGRFDGLLVRWCEDDVRSLVTDDAGDGTAVAGEDPAGQPECGQQPALTLGAQSGRQRQSQPGGKCFGICRGCGLTQGLRTPSAMVTVPSESITRA